jgi:hypothetical protein
MLLSQYAKADPLLNTDDADIVSAKHCQLESAVTRPSGSQASYQLNTACQFIEGLKVRFPILINLLMLERAMVRSS